MPGWYGAAGKKILKGLVYTDEFSGGSSRQQAYHPEHSRSRVKRAVIWVAVLLPFALILFLLLRHKGGAQEGGRNKNGGPVAVTTATAKKGDIHIYLDAIGTVTPLHTTSITSQVNGIIVTVHYTEGEFVRKGTPLIDIDSRTYRATLLQAEGTLEKDEGLLAQARMDLKRYQDAWRRNAIPRQQMEDQEKLVLQDEGIVKSDHGTVNYDKVQVEYCHITAPISGKIGLRLVDPGNVVQSNGSTPLAVVTQLQPITVIFTIPEDSLGTVEDSFRRNGALQVDAFDRTAQKKIASGSLLTLDNQIDTTTGTVKGRAIFDNGEGLLFPNQFVNTRLLVNTLRGVTLIPSSAVQHNGNVAFVYVIQNNTAEMRNVKAGATEGNFTAVKGISPGEIVADSSFDKLRDKAAVMISRKGSRTAPSGLHGK